MFENFFKWWVSYNKQGLLILCEYLDSSRDCFRVNRVAQFSVRFFSFIMCLVYPVLMVSLDCPFLTTHSVFSNVYINICLKQIILFLSKEEKSLESFLRRLQTLLKHYGRKISCCYRCLLT
jgi:hypothetical protein